MIKVVNVNFPEDTMYISKETLKSDLKESLAEGMVGHQNDASYFFTHRGGVDDGVLPLVAKAVDKEKYDELIRELIDEEMVFTNFDTLSIEEGIEDLYKNKIVDNYDLFELVDLNKLADSMIENKCGWVFYADAYNDFSVDLADIDWTDVEKPVKEYAIGDSYEFEDGRCGIVEDMDDKNYIIRDCNGNTFKVKVVKDSEHLTFGQVSDIFSKHNSENGIKSQYADENPLYAVAVISADSFDQEYSLEERSYKFRSDNKRFIPSQIGGSIFADSLDGSDTGVRLDWYIWDGDWKVEYCYLLES